VHSSTALDESATKSESFRNDYKESRNFLTVSQLNGAVVSSAALGCSSSLSSQKSRNNQVKRVNDPRSARRLVEMAVTKIDKALKIMDSV